MPGLSGGSRNILAIFLIGFGAFLLVAAILLPTYATSKLKKTPLDLEITTVSEGSGSVLNIAQFLSGNPDAVEDDVPLRAQRFVTVEDPSDARIVTIQAGFTLSRTDRRGAQGLLNATVDRVTTDRVTAMPVTDPPGSLQVAADQPAIELPREGLQYKFPFDVEKKSYPYFDINARSTIDIDFVDEITIDGLPVYQFSHTIEPVDLFRVTRDQANRLGLPKSVWGLSEADADDADEIVFMSRYYANTRNVFVEPVTGIIVSGNERIRQYFGTTPDEPALTVLSYDAELNEATVTDRVAAAEASKNRIQMQADLGPVTVRLPWILAVFGTLSLIVGIVLGTRRSRE
ncbi:DUF3068 domain-containing protein [Hoyosella rhizosphaerae]|uniref:Membrane protein n=1 Tax=Hoyosella rhizosphaerae TaxID=1755582 RepID=A0A916XDR1_9ACTN|nr:DUF3068 domain-containing protein [Hoyosella rhizosphaerae]MBN4927441.1 DUF3068 domain-containing protein [Hoyosella rhizosphaerae]GGC64360.1 membrane protein [Hoyosella rhizosphaerae]